MAMQDAAGGTLATTLASVGSMVNQSLAQAGVYGSQAQQVALYQPLAPPAIAGGQTAYTAGLLQQPVLILVGIVAVVIVGLALIFRRG